MDKKFIEKYKLLKLNFTKLTQADTTTQSKYEKFKDDKSSDNIISNAKKLIISEQIEGISDAEITRIKEQSLIQYERDLQKYGYRKNRICEKDNIKWNDEIFNSPLPHPKNNSEYLKNPNSSVEKEKKEKNKLFSNIVLNKIESLYDKSRSEENKIEIEEIDTSKKNKLENRTVDVRTKVEMIENTKENCKLITDIPELKITPQIHNKVEFLEIKKISIEDKDFNLKELDENKEIDKKVLSNSLIKWKKYTTQNKESRKNLSNKKIDSFLENLQKMKFNKLKSKSDLANNFQNTNIIATKIKPKSSSSETKVTLYENRFRAQKNVIDMQKQKLEEQEKLIQDLKLNRIKNEARESFESAKELRKSLLVASKQKYKLKTEEQIEINKNETIVNTNIELNLSLNLFKAPKIVKMMEERAIERQERRLLIQEKKRIIDEEKKRQAEELVRRKLKEEIEEKKERMARMKKQRDQIRQMELRKQFEKKRYIELNEKAAEHYKKTLKQINLNRFKMLVYNVKINFEMSKRLYEHNIVLYCFNAWKNYAAEIILIKNRYATDLLRKKLLMTAMTTWKLFRLKIIKSRQVADDYYEISLQSRYFIAWHKLICYYRIQYATNVKKADNYYRRVLLYNCLANWRSLPEILEIEKIQNERKRKWRLRVAEILSDYDPLKNYEY